MNDAATPSAAEYTSALAGYCSSRLEESLYEASLLGRRFVESGLGPDEIVALHADALSAIVAGMPLRQTVAAGVDALQFLLELMIGYGVHYREYFELRLGERARVAEAHILLERQHALQAEQADQEKSDLLAAIAHELRTPLTAAAGFVDLSMRELERKPPPAIRSRLEQAREAISRVTRLTTQLAEASRGGPPALDRSPLELGPLVAQACNWAGPAAGQKGVTLVAPQRDLPGEVCGNADALLSIFGNLLSNAIRYTHAGGTVSVACSTTEHEVSVAVVDTGIGMTPEVRARIFEKFFRSEEARETEPGGLGLGLVIALQLVEAHGGRLEIESKSGAGSEFRVVLPLARDYEEERIPDGQ